jgi:membrane protein implicated in regulation of membrane protease activity
MFSPAFWWALAGIGLMICEFAMPGLILLFFGLGALFTALLTWLLPLSLPLQLLVFTIASLVSLFALRRFLKPIFTGRTTAVQEDALSEGMTGSEGVVSEPITPGTAGKIILNGTAWKAESEEALEAGQTVVVVGQKSLTLFVKRK